ncbi:hypothetical protein [Streptomyces sp. NPDC127190]|uniref:hypothetical protein n=1 Tax=unclassified Streptomyces TaxID=2593676 RepID=UPI0036385D53
MNHGPDDKPAERFGEPDGREKLDGSGVFDSFGQSIDQDRADGAEDGLDPDAAALRRMLHSAVGDLEPRTGTLDHLRRAVPARRARKRQAAVGMAAAALFIGTAIPALIHVSGVDGSSPDTAMAGESSQAQGGTGQAHGDKGSTPRGAKGTPGTVVQPSKDPGKGGKKGTGGGSTGSTGGTGPSTSASAGLASCTSAQLGSATGSAAAPDSAGVVYGTFRVVNVSTTACTVAGPGSIGASAQGAADPAKILTARHVAGDAATGLPDPSQEVSGLVLQPGAAYEEKFAFVPSAACPTTGGDNSGTGGTDTGGPTADPSPSQDATPGTTTTAGTTDGGTTSEGTTTQLMTADGTADGSVLISHTSAGGAPSAATVVPGECAGTVYYTGVLPGA